MAKSSLIEAARKFVVISGNPTWFDKLSPASQKEIRLAVAEIKGGKSGVGPVALARAIIERLKLTVNETTVRKLLADMIEGKRE
jgi:hypothetical protein